MTRFVDINPTLDAYWRAIVLFGRNSASYKFALAKSLLEIADEETNFITLEDLAEPFATHIAKHLSIADKQGTSASSKFLDACRQFNAGEINKQQLLETTVQLGFNNVIDAFHVVNQEEIPYRFFIDDRKSKNGITISDELFNLKEDAQFKNLPFEVEARWRLVETAWDVQISPSLLIVKHDNEIGELYINIDEWRRKGVTSARDALNGYQKGHCFYCFAEISIARQDDSTCDVDHFFPIILSRFEEYTTINLNGVWNLVLSCRECNRGVGGKSAKIPKTRYLERLHQRNNYLIDSHHPLRETLLLQTGRSEAERRGFLQEVYKESVNHLIHQWQPISEGLPVF